MKTLSILFGLTVIYLWVAGAAWQWRNPTANEMTLIKEFPSVVTFQKVPEYQK